MSVPLSVFSSNVPPPTQDDIASTIRSSFGDTASRCLAVGLHSKASTSGTDTWNLTDYVENEGVRTEQGDMQFKSAGKDMRIVFQWQNNGSFRGTRKQRGFWAVISALNDKGTPEANNLTVFCEGEQALLSHLAQHDPPTDARLYYGPGYGIEMAADSPDWLVVIRDDNGFRASPLNPQKDFDTEMKEKLDDLVKNGHAYALEHDVSLPALAELDEVRDALISAATYAGQIERAAAWVALPIRDGK